MINNEIRNRRLDLFEYTLSLSTNTTSFINHPRHNFLSEKIFFEVTPLSYLDKSTFNRSEWIESLLQLSINRTTISIFYLSSCLSEKTSPIIIASWAEIQSEQWTGVNLQKSVRPNKKEVTRNKQVSYHKSHGEQKPSCAEIGREKSRSIDNGREKSNAARLTFTQEQLLSHGTVRQGRRLQRVRWDRPHFAFARRRCIPVERSISSCNRLLWTSLLCLVPLHAESFVRRTLSSSTHLEKSPDSLSWRSRRTNCYSGKKAVNFPVPISRYISPLTFLQFYLLFTNMIPAGFFICS